MILLVTSTALLATEIQFVSIAFCAFFYVKVTVSVICHILIVCFFIILLLIIILHEIIVSASCLSDSREFDFTSPHFRKFSVDTSSVFL